MSPTGMDINPGLRSVSPLFLLLEVFSNSVACQGMRPPPQDLWSRTHGPRQPPTSPTLLLNSKLKECKGDTMC